MALALAAMVATTTAAHASSIGIGIDPVGTTHNCGGSCTDQSFQITSGGTYGTVGTGVTGATWSSASSSYNFAYTGYAATQSTVSTPGGAYGVDQYVAMDASTVNNSPTSGILALDADYSGNVGTVTLTLADLTASTTYSLTYDVEETQQLWSPGNNGSPQGSCTGGSSTFCDTPFQAGLTVSGTGGANEIYDPAGEPAGQDASAWVAETFTFTTGASQTNEVITFDPTSTDTTNVPAFALVDSVVLSTTSPVPEPNSLLLLSSGLLGLGGFLRMRSKNSAAAKA